MRVTVAICTWNRATSLERTLEQMQRLVIPDAVKWELLVVNNACTDNTNAVIDRFTGRLPIRQLLEPRMGQSRARNTAIRESTGELIVWTDDDVLVDPDWLAAIVRSARSSGADFVFGRSVPKWPGTAPQWYSD